MLDGIEAMHMMRKGQVKRLDENDAVGQSKFVESLFGIAAWFGEPAAQFLDEMCL